MAGFVSKILLKKVFAENKENKQGQEDPYFETVPASRLGFKTKKKLPRALPPGLTKEEERSLVKAKRRAYRVDLALGSFMGIKFGWGSVIGLVPAIGDAMDLLLALMVYRTITSVEPQLDTSLKMKMKLNIIIDFVVGLVPFIGDIADAAYKCNTKNVILFEDELRKRGQKRLKGTPQENMTDPSLADEFDYQTADGRANASHGGPPPRYTSNRRDNRRDDRRGDRRRDYDDSTVDLESQTDTMTDVTPPRRARTRDHRR